MSSFEIILKDDRTEIEIIVTRALLAIAAAGAYTYTTDWNYFAGMALSLLLLLSSFFIKTILYRLKINRVLFFGLAAVLTFITTHSILFAVVLMVYGLLLHRLKRKVRIELNDSEIIIHYAFYKRPVQWEKLNNVILKDRILTIDFKTDKLIQAEIAAESFDIDEQQFNGFCTRQLQNKG